MIEVPINYLAVIVAAVATMVIGFLWYGPLFGKQWSRLMGWGEMTPEKMKEMQKKAVPGYAIQFIGALFMAYVLAHVLVFSNAYFNVSGVAVGIEAGFWSWLGFIAPVTVGSILWEGKPFTLWLINAGYFLVNLLMIGAILGAWA